MSCYDQPLGQHGYDVIESPLHAYWMPVLDVQGNRCIHPFDGGYKVHVSVDPSDADRVARRILPELQAWALDHKVYHDVATYRAQNEGDQKGKFITIYPGPVLEGFTRLVNRLDPILLGMKAMPGPAPRARLKNHAETEQRIGLSGLLFYVTVLNYRV